MKNSFRLIFSLLYSLSIFAVTPSTELFDYVYRDDFTGLEKLGGWASGGGNTVVCFDPNSMDLSLAFQEIKENGGKIPDKYIPFITDIEMYDLYEARLPRGFDQTKPEIININDNESFSHYTKRIMSRFERSLPSILTTIERGSFLLRGSKVRFFDGPVSQVNDINTVIGDVDTNSCVISTMAIQRNINDFFTLYIDARLFNHPNHSKQSKATLLLHEYIYTQARTKGHRTSAETRELVGLSITRHPDYAVDFVASMVANLGFEVRNSPLLRTKDSHILLSGLVETATLRTTVIHSIAASAFVNTNCASKCLSLVKKLEELAPNIAPPRDWTAYRVLKFLAEVEYPNETIKKVILGLINETLEELKFLISEEIDRRFEASFGAPDSLYGTEHDKRGVTV
ncbi:MAG: hypothetical protein NXH75_08115, partial [Halobacteriovoraceae bacterium]|nr:hypothetical protein [Halobacteriovoraceae bacterium]